MSSPPAESPAAAASPDFPGSPTSPTEQGPEVKIDPSKDLWSNILTNVKDSNADQSDLALLVLGSKESGKSSVINRYLDRGGKPKPTTALEYCFKKIEDRTTTIVHLWELAQGTELASLADVVLTPENVPHVSAMIVLDCTNPNVMFETLHFWLKRLDQRVSEIFQKMRAKNSSTPDKMLNKMKKNYIDANGEHPDLSRLRLTGVPTAIVVNKLDAYKDTQRLRTMVLFMRFIAHLHGASLIFTSEKDTPTFKSWMNALVMRTPSTHAPCFDSDSGNVLIPAGMDSFDQIGRAPDASAPNFEKCSDDALDPWKALMDYTFPPKADEGSKSKDVTDGYQEPAVDAMRKQKDDELEQYRRSQAKKSTEKQQD